MKKMKKCNLLENYKIYEHRRRFTELAMAENLRKSFWTRLRPIQRKCKDRRENDQSNIQSNPLTWDQREGGKRY